MTLAELLTLAEREQIISPVEAEQVSAAAAAETARPSLPWYLHVVIALGAWIGSGCAVGFLFAIFGGMLEREHATSMVLGLCLIGGAAALRWVRDRVFLSQICLALSWAGHGLFFYGLSQATEQGQQLRASAVCAAFLAGALYFIHPDRLHRFLSTFAALALLNIWGQSLGYDNNHWSYNPDHYRVSWQASVAFHISTIAHLAILLAIFLRPGGRVLWRPFGYATAFSLIGLFLYPDVVSILSPRSLLTGFANWSSVPIAAATLFSAGGWKRAQHQRQVWLALTMAIAVLAFTAGPATLLAIFFLVLGYGLQDRAFLVLGTLLLPAFFFLHYYNMAQSLLLKSLYLLASGLILLGLRYALAKVRWNEPTRMATI